MHKDSVLAANTSFPEVDQIAMALFHAGLLSGYVRPYANQERSWERSLERLSGLGTFYTRSFGRRRMLHLLGSRKIWEAGLLWDFVMALHSRLPSSTPCYRSLRATLSHLRTNAVFQAAAKCLSQEKMVIASWGCAEAVFRRIKARGGQCVLNYPLAHHRFTRRYLLQEAELQPTFADSINSHDYPRWLEARLDAEIDLADRILIGSSFVRESFIGEGVPADKLIIIPYGVDTHMFKPYKSGYRRSGPLRLIFVGQICQRKGISYLLETARRMEGKFNSLTLVGQIHGDGRSLIPYRHLFRHIPHVPRIELCEIYRQADIFVFPTLVEGLPIVVLEAMASGLPVITTPNGPGDIVRDGVDGFLVPSRDVKAIADRLEYLRENPVLLKEMGQNARERALKFTWDRYRKKIVRAVLQLMEIN